MPYRVKCSLGERGLYKRLLENFAFIDILKVLYVSAAYSLLKDSDRE